MKIMRRRRGCNANVIDKDVYSDEFDFMRVKLSESKGCSLDMHHDDRILVLV